MSFLGAVEHGNCIFPPVFHWKILSEDEVGPGEGSVWTTALLIANLIASSRWQLV